MKKLFLILCYISVFVLYVSLLYIAQTPITKPFILLTMTSAFMALLLLSSLFDWRPAVRRHNGKTDNINDNINNNIYDSTKKRINVIEVFIVVTCWLIQAVLTMYSVPNYIPQILHFIVLIISITSVIFNLYLHRTKPTQK